MFVSCLLLKSKIVVKTRYHEGSVSCYKQNQSYITIHEVPTKQNGRRVKYSFCCRLVEVNRKSYSETKCEP